MKSFVRRKENVEALLNVLSAIDQDGRPAVNASHRLILEYVASFPRGKCFASNKTINKFTCRSRDQRTIDRNIAYLVYTKLLKERFNGKQRILELGCFERSVVSQKVFRHGMGIKDYDYMKAAQNDQETIEFGEGIDMENISDEEAMNKIMSELFFDEKPQHIMQKVAENMSHNPGNFPGLVTNYPCILEQNTKTIPTVSNDFKRIHPSNSPRTDENLVQQGSLLASPASGVGRTDCRPQRTALNGPLNEGDIFKKKENGKDPIPMSPDHEPILPTSKRKPKAKTTMDRRNEASNMIIHGHVANPLGIVDNRPRRLNPKLARDVPIDKISTVPQLYRFLLRKYQEVFGEDIMGKLMPDDKSAVAQRFSELGQKFRDCCSFEPRRSDLAAYFEWFLDPNRVQKLMQSIKLRGQNIYVSWEQMTGSVYIKRFHDEVLAKREGSTVFLEETKGSKVRRVYEKLASYEKNRQSLMIAIVNAGYVLSGQFLHDEKEMLETECTEYVVSLMTEFIKTSSDRQKAIEFLRTIENSTKLNMNACQSDCIWYDWTVKCKWMLDKAIEASS